MILQCQKCNLFFRSFAKMKHHKAGTLGEQCAGEEKKAVIEKPEEPVQDDSNPWNYNIIPATPVVVKEDVKSEEVNCVEGVKEGGEVNVDKTIAKDDNLGDLKNPPKEETEEKNDIKIKTEPLEADSEVKIKEEPVDGDIPFLKREPYADGIYKAAPIVLDSDSDEFEPESDESAPSDDDVETHLGLMRRNTYKVKAKKRKKVTPANGTVIYIKNAAGQKVKKYAVQKESTRWVPPHPWVPYRNQVTVEQVCQFLEMVDYPIAMNEALKKKFEDKQAFDDYAMPLFKKMNPDAHPLTLMTLVKAKWFEVMNTVNEEVEKDETEHIVQSENLITEEKMEELKQEVETKPATPTSSQFATKISVKPPLQKKIRLNWTL